MPRTSPSKRETPSSNVRAVACPKKLQQAWRENTLVLFLGAGVSQGYGLPSWNELVLSLLLDESAADFEGYWPHYRVPLASWLTETLGISATSMAQLARIYARDHQYDDAQFREYVRDVLYRFQTQPQGQTTLSAVASLLQRSVKPRGAGHIPAVVTFNYDDLLERELRARQVKFNVVFDATRRPVKSLSILHVHGYLPWQADVPLEDIVLTEDEYHRRSFAAFHWSHIDLASLLRNYSVLFIGLSMSDPNLRRMLSASHGAKDGINHWVLRREYVISDEQRARARKTISQAAKRQAERLGVYGAEKKDRSLDRALDEMLTQARTYETDLLRGVGVDSIWLPSYDDIPRFLNRVGRG